MTSVKKIFVSLAVLSTLISGRVSAADEQPQAKSQEWITLFDGKSVDKLRGYKMEGFPDKSWKVAEGALQTVIVKGAVKDLITKETFADFELVCEWRMTPGGNAGIMYRVTEEGSNPWHTGPEYQVLDDTTAPDGKNPKTSTGALYAMIAPSEKELKAVGEWNTTRIVFKNNTVQHWLNEKKVVEYIWGSDELKALIAQSKFKKMPLFATKDRGHIVFQHHRSNVWFRNIKVRPL